ncbi:MAG: AsmA-like C-terminal region-containing protein, partial [Bacteroidota bacterium]|nr:AsmA-like C-terminal region-containing protein [Bacteroidota bacterium]MDX5505623.1 AsmA-like C-terminal region-containing protein [Bacteroidota bacterium]
MIRTATLTLVFLFSSTFLYSGTFTAISSGNWSNGAIWSSSGGGNPTPGKNDDVYIPGGFTVTVNSLQEAKTVTLQGNNSSLVLNATLKVVKAVGGTDAVIFDGTSLTAGNTQIIRINSGGLLDMRASATKQENILFSASPLGIQKIVFASNTSPSDGINCADLTMGNSNTLIEYETGGQATIFIGDDLTGGSLVPGSGTVEFHGSLTGGPTQEIRGQYTFYNLGFRSQQPKYLGMANASTPSSQYSFTVQNNLYLSRSTGNQGTPPVLYLEAAVLNINGDLVLNDSSQIVIDGSGSFAPDSAGIMIGGDLILKDVNQNASSSSNLTIQNYSSSIQDLIVLDGELTMDGSITSNQKHGWYLRGKSTLRGNWPQSAINALMANMRGDDTVRISGLIFIDGTLTLDGGTLELAATGPGNDLHLDALSLLNGSGVILNSNDLIIKGTFPSSSDGLRVEDAGSFIDGSGGGWLEFSSSSDQDIRILSAANDFRIDNLKASGGSGNLTIQIGSGLDSLSAYGKVLIETGKNLNTNGGLILRSTSSSEYAQAFRTGTGTITGDFRLERTIASTTTAGWRNMAIPVTSGSIGSIRGVRTFVTNDSSQYHIYTWDASQNGSTGLANGWSVVLDPATANDGSKGYILYMGPPFFNLRKNPIDITGGFRSGSQAHTLYKYFDPQGPTQSSTIEQGWNFLPNPYSANLSIPAIISAVPTYKAVHVYDPSSGQYAAYTSSTAINYNTGSTNA